MEQLEKGYNYLEDNTYFFGEIPNKRAIEIANYGFFWDVSDELAPFGCEEAYIAFTELSDWLIDNPNTPLIECFIWILKSWDLELEDFHDDIIECESILKIIHDLDFYEELMSLDYTIISTGFGQLILQGKIDIDVKNIVQLSILRQMNSHVLDAFLGNNEQWKYERYLYLQRLLEILEEA
ncbi:hypothetical protein [Methanobrevibacter olleyae]|uniref:Uncharacterized protein n=1 Tax=Methanobrevibacter olleyae TaxID=294671 RepID=A0A126QZ56_METOL|nr:hypothetical protein [Methanobrevibacter olleyae]AMK15062.1 hypothetical protein YLM1_0505 [Methanobrevibacter olleyae]SFL39831.1 hypothetical protein SAMN02910297_00778 [Methanobrevibacter olleyae]